MMRLLDLLAQPPLNCLALAAVGLLLMLRWKRAGRAVLIVAGIGLWLFSTPLFASALLVSAQAFPALPSGDDRPDAEAIVVLSAGFRRDAPEYGRSTLGPLALERVRYAAALARQTGRPLLVSGGTVSDEPRPHAVMMKETLESEFEGIQARHHWMT